MNENKNILYLKKEIIKIRNSKAKYIEIPSVFKELSNGDITDMIEKINTEDEISVVFTFNKKNLKKQIEEL